MPSSSADSPLDYERLRKSLAAAGPFFELAELHGGVCGALCVGGTPAARRWLADYLGDQSSHDVPSATAKDLDELVVASEKMLGDEAFAFEPLLPDDDAPLAEQVAALASWCQGFLNGVGSSAPAALRAPAEDAALPEILRDFAELSRAGLSAAEAAGRDQPDFALAELHEYVRVSVQLVFEELGAERAAAMAPRELH
jgi:uncharacterized protein YgfB (UPF0149 family)